MPSRRLIIIMLLLVSLIIGACGTDGDDEDAQGGPTAPPFPTITPQTTQTGTAVANQPTGLPTFGPTATRFGGFPTLSAPPTVPSRYPNQIQIISPVSGQQIAGNVGIFGSASHPDFVQYTLEYGPDPNPSGLWYPITPQAVTIPVINSTLGAWNTTLVQDGNYQLRLHVYLTNRREVTNVIVAGLQVRNSLAPTAPPANTAPTISPIAPLNLERGRSATIALGIYDANGDSTTFIASSDNTAIATVTPSGQAITVTGLNPGVATIRIRVSDNRGGSAETSFLTTVVQPQQQNNPPNIAPIPSQVLSQGATVSQPLQVFDPNGDTFTVTVQSAAPAIAGVSLGANNQSINIAGFSPGTTTVTVTAQDVRGLSNSIAFTVVVNPPQANNPPSIAAVSGQTLEVNQSKEITLSISDPDNDTTTFTTSSSNNNIVTVNTQPANTIRLTGRAEGAANITITVTDSRGASTSTVFSVNVTVPPPSNRNPTIDPIPDQTVEVSQTIQVDLRYSDPDGDPLTLSSSSENTGIATTGQIDPDTISVSGVTEGPTRITVSVGDGKGGSASTTFTVNVTPATVPNRPPVLDPINSQTLNVGDTRAVTINYSDPDNEPVSIFVNSDEPSIVSVTQSAVFELTLIGQAAGSATISVEVDDGRGGTATQEFLVTVNAANQNPTVSDIPDQTCEVGDTLTLPVNASDPDPGDTVTVTPTSSSGAATTSVVNTTLTVNCVSEGSATITLTVTDNKGGSAVTDFNVAVGAGNQPPVLDAIPDQFCDVSQTLTLTLGVTDPDGDTVSITASLAPEGVVSSSVSNTTLTLNCLAGGSTTVTVNADDGQGNTDSANFTVTVSVPPPPPVNQNPVLGDVSDQSCDQNGAISVNLTFSDPDGDTVTVNASSNNPGVANPTVVGSTVNIACGVAGSALITLTASDDKGGTATDTFGVTVNPPANQNPVLTDIPDQVCDEKTGLTVNITYSDPDGDSISVTPSSSDPNVANPSFAPPNIINVTCNIAGNATITVSLNDGRGGSASDTFGVTVNPPANQNPTIGTINPITLEVNQAQVVAISYSDPDGDVLNVTPQSDNPGVADVVLSSPTELTVTAGPAAGVATITVIVDDGRGGIATTTFGVTVNDSAPPPFNIGDYPELPDFAGLDSTLQPFYNNAVNNLGRNPNAFSVAGDDSLVGANFMDPIAAGTYNLGSFGNLQDTVTYFNFAFTSAATNAGWNPSSLLDPSATNHPECNPGETPLDCELRRNTPVVIIISFKPENVVSMAQDTFRIQLEAVVDRALAAGTIPVLVALPDDGNPVNDYNRIMVEVSENKTVPLWNLHTTMQGAASGIYAASPSGPTDYTDGSLTFGVNRRGLTALRVLDSFRITFTN